jgi:hypothetical protein
MGKIAVRLAGIAAIILTLAGMLTAGAAPVAALPGQDVPGLVGCAGPAVRPSYYDAICNDGAGAVVRLRWSAWGAKAAGYGLFFTHKCVPDCALGSITLYPVDLVAWRVQGGDYTRLEYFFPGRRPVGFPRSWVLTYAGGLWHGRLV